MVGRSAAQTEQQESIVVSIAFAGFSSFRMICVRMMTIPTKTGLSWGRPVPENWTPSLAVATATALALALALPDPSPWQDAARLGTEAHPGAEADG